ncbi:MAG TPA: thioesterase family protein [Sediminibacterium sp.]|nr:thioesterase family protein [Sediminibacterium sp.]
MNRIKLQIPDTFHFTTEIAVRITDINYGGHLGNDSFLTLLQEARQQYLHAYGYAELSFEGTGLIMADAVLEFKKEIRYPCTMRISVAAADFDKLGFDLYYLLELVTPAGLILAGRAKTGMLCFDYAQKKKVAVPDAAVQKLGGPPRHTI